MKLFLQKKMQNFRALGALPPDTRASGGSPPDPHWPLATGGSAPRHPKQPPHCEFLATRLQVKKQKFPHYRYLTPKLEVIETPNLVCELFGYFSPIFLEKSVLS